MFITLEGGEGSGKTTQVTMLARALEERGHRIVKTREPGGTPEGEKIRPLVVERTGGDWTPMAECLLLFASRAMHVEKVIKPALAQGKVVISDRFTDSTIAYEGYGRCFSIEAIKRLNALVLDCFGPDLTFLLDIDSKSGLERSLRRLGAEELRVKPNEDRFEKMDIGFHERVRRGYLDIASDDPERVKIIDATLPPEKLAEEIQELVLKTLERQ